MELTVLLVLCLVIFIAYKRNINTGLLGIVAAFVLGFFILVPAGKTGLMVPISSAAGKAKLIISGWSSSMFLTLLGVTFLFGIAKVNRTLEILTKKIVFLVNGKKILLPIVVFLIAFVVSAIGPGPVNGMAIVAPIAAQIADSEGLNPFFMMIASYAGNLAGGLAPITPSGFVASSYAQKGGVDLGYNLLLNMFIAFTLTFIVTYILMKGWKADEGCEVKPQQTVEKMDAVNWFTLGVIALVIMAVIFGNYNIGLCALTGAVLLMLFGAATEKEALGQIPWGTILMVCGMGVLVNIVGYAGGIKYLTDALTPYINETTAAPIMLLSGALMSAVASASGVVMPTLIPVAIQLGSNLGLDPKPLIYGIVLGAHFSCVSPFSTVGGLALGALGNNVDKQKMFLYFLQFAIGSTVVGAILVYFKLLLYF